MFTSCGGGGCDDLSTANNAAACLCSMVSEAKEMKDGGTDKDSDEAKELMENMANYNKYRKIFQTKSILKMMLKKQ